MTLISGNNNSPEFELKTVKKESELKDLKIKSQQEEIENLRIALLESCKKIDFYMAKVIIFEEDKRQTNAFLKELRTDLEINLIFLDHVSETSKGYEKHRAKQIKEKIIFLANLL